MSFIYKPVRTLLQIGFPSKYIVNNAVQSFIKGSTISIIRHYSISKGVHGDNPSPFKEIEIPLPYGKIAAKAWGSETGTRVLALHGWLDNCGTFDKLIPLLSNQFYFVTIDAPGHGRSSHLPPGALYTDMSLILDFKRATDHLGWEKFHLLGHSLGGSLALMFASLFPSSVDKVISLDIIKAISCPADQVHNIKMNAVNKLLEIEKKLLNPAPVYSKESAPVRLKNGMHHEITEEGAEILLKRGAKPSDCGKGVVFSRDLRCHPVEYINIESNEVVKTFMQELQCQLLIIMANSSHRLYQPETSETIAKYVAMYRNNLKNFMYERVEGNHFVHLNNPERIVPIINKFLLN